MGRMRTTTGSALSIILTGLLLVGCGGGGGGSKGTAPTPTLRRAGDLEIQALNSVTGQQYRYRVAGDTITLTAPATNDPVKLGRFIDEGSGVVAEAFWKSGQPQRTDQQVCVTLASVLDLSSPDAADAALADRTSVHLPGVALRVRPATATVPAAAITITQSVYNAVMWMFDVNGVEADVAGSKVAAKVVPIESVDFSNIVGRWSGTPGTGDLTSDMKPPPWHLCARAIGTNISLKVWTDAEPEPEWEDEDHVRTVTVDRGRVYRGYAGGYEHGLSPGRSSVFTGLEVTSPY